MFLVNSVSHLLYGDFKGGVYPPFSPYPPFPVPFAPSPFPLPFQTLFPRSFLKRWFFSLFIEPFQRLYKKSKNSSFKQIPSLWSHKVYIFRYTLQRIKPPQTSKQGLSPLDPTSFVALSFPRTKLRPPPPSHMSVVCCVLKNLGFFHFMSLFCFYLFYIFILFLFYFIF